MFLFVFVFYHVTVWMGSNKLNWTELIIWPMTAIYIKSLPFDVDSTIIMWILWQKLSYAFSKMHQDCIMLLFRCKNQVKTKTWYWFLLLTYASVNVVVSFHVVQLCFLYKQSSHSVSVHNAFYDAFGFDEFTWLCSAYSVCRQLHGHFRTSVLHAFRVLRATTVPAGTADSAY